MTGTKNLSLSPATDFHHGLLDIGTWRTVKQTVKSGDVGMMKATYRPIALHAFRIDLAWSQY